MNLPYQTFIQRLATQLAGPLPGRRAHNRFASRLSYGRHSGPPQRDARRAAVVALLFRQAGQWCIPLTLRPDHLPDHAGQICLPGGMADPGESAEQTALRELHEELGIGAEQVELIGPLTPLYVFASNFWVRPFVAAARGQLGFSVNPHEVAEVVMLPVAQLLDRRNYGSHQLRYRAAQMTVPHIQYGGHRIWGATSMILGELAELLRQADRPPSHSADVP